MCIMSIDARQPWLVLATGVWDFHFLVRPSHPSGCGMEPMEVIVTIVGGRMVYVPYLGDVQPTKKKELQSIC